MFQASIITHVNPVPVVSMPALHAGVSKLNSIEKLSEGQRLASLVTEVGDLSHDLNVPGSECGKDAILAGCALVAVRALSIAIANGATLEKVQAALGEAGADFANSALEAHAKQLGEPA